MTLNCHAEGSDVYFTINGIRIDDSDPRYHVEDSDLNNSDWNRTLVINATVSINNIACVALGSRSGQLDVRVANITIAGEYLSILSKFYD